MDIRKKLALLDELDNHLDERGGEDMKGMPFNEEGESVEHGEPDGDEGTPAALVVEVGAPKDGPPKPPGVGGGDPAADLAKAALESSDPKVKALAEALLKTKGL